MAEPSQLGLALEMRAVRKSFPGTVAIDGVDFSVYAGEVHALLGENGAGKSTLMKMLAGCFSDYHGEILISGQPVRLHSPAAAARHGVGMVYQELSLARPISIAENILAGRLPVKHGVVVDRARRDALTRAALQRVGLELHPATPVETLSQHEAQLVEIAKVLQRRPCILVMDEPTSSLSRTEIDRLFEIVARLREQGLAIVYVSHHIPEIFRIADRITVLRDGKRVATRAISEVTQTQLIEMMVGHDATGLYGEKPHRTPGQPRLRGQGLTRYGFFHDISFEARTGEILGLGGLSGAGRSELARSIVGADPLDAGGLELDGRPFRPRHLSDAIAKGVVYLTEDRKTEGLALRLTVRENALAALLPRLAPGGWYRPARGAATLRRLMDELRVHPADPAILTRNLSGGNQQKVLLAKWLAVEPRVLILDEPTRGVDVGAKLTIHKAVEALADRGHAVILISSDLPELVTLSDRVMIMRQGHIIREMAKRELSEDAVLLAANGGG
ncbi:MAG: sugar ABC transporter ATP-binding protein [Kiritimatiellae bacterium]|nr:sugar ABC transporter ATP-binding protein [Kiritimatiellia bacterium]